MYFKVSSDMLKCKYVYVICFRGIEYLFIYFNVWVKWLIEWYDIYIWYYGNFLLFLLYFLWRVS